MWRMRVAAIAGLLVLVTALTVGVVRGKVHRSHVSAHRLAACKRNFPHRIPYEETPPGLGDGNPPRTCREAERRLLLCDDGHLQNGHTFLKCVQLLEGGLVMD